MNSAAYQAGRAQYGPLHSSRHGGQQAIHRSLVQLLAGVPLVHHSRPSVDCPLTCRRQLSVHLRACARQGSACRVSRSNMRLCTTRAMRLLGSLFPWAEGRCAS